MRDTLDAAPILANRRATTEAIASALMYCAHWDTLTTRPTWDRLIDYCKATTGKGSRATVARAIALLIDLNLIARVAHGRQGKYAPGNPDTNPNEAAVYVLLAPSPVRVVQDETAPNPCAPVDKVDTPPTPSVVIDLPVPARAGTPDLVPLRGPEHLFTAQAPPPNGAQCRPLPAWPGHATALRRDEMLAAAFELQRRLPVLRQISARDVRFCLKKFFESEWTIADIVQALDWRPDGTRWPHSGATGITATVVQGKYRAAPVRGWIAHRLAPWMVEGEPRKSFGQRGDEQRTQRRARQQAERDRDAQRRASTSTPSPIAAAVKAHLGHVRFNAPEPECQWC